MAFNVSSMKRYNAGIRAIGMALGTKRITNKDLETMCDTTDEWIQSHTGITQRFIAEDNVATSDLMVEAGKEALQKAGLDPKKIDGLVVGTCTPDHKLPATSANVQGRLGLSNAFAFDLNAGGCPNSMYALTVGAQFIMMGQCKHVLVILGDKMSTVTNWHNRNCNYFFGDGAGAFLLSRTREDTGIVSYELGTDGTKYEEILIPCGGSRTPLTQETLAKRLDTLRLDGPKVKEFVLSKVPDSIRRVCKEGNLPLDEIDGIYLHQANLRLIEAILADLQIPFEKTYTVIQRLANTSGSSLPVTLYHALKDGKLQPGQKVVLAAFGSGYGYGCVYLKWCAEEDFIDE